MTTQPTGPRVLFTATTRVYTLDYACNGFIDAAVGTEGELVAIRRLADFTRYIVRLTGFGTRVQVDFGNTIEIAPMTTERADALIENHPVAEFVEDSEEIGGEVVYTLEDGSALHVDQLGAIRHCPAE